MFTHRACDCELLNLRPDRLLSVTRFGPKVGQFGPKWDKSGAFSDQISVHLAPRMCPIWGQSDPFWVQI